MHVGPFELVEPVGDGGSVHVWRGAYGPTGDIKPANILRFQQGGQPRLKLSDFGIAQALDPESTRLDREHLTSSAGTPRYMPPEQLLGKWRTVGPWTDLYALGCTAWELASGATPLLGLCCGYGLDADARRDRVLAAPMLAMAADQWRELEETEALERVEALEKS